MIPDKERSNVNENPFPYARILRERVVRIGLLAEWWRWSISAAQHHTRSVIIFARAAGAITANTIMMQPSRIITRRSIWTTKAPLLSSAAAMAYAETRA